MLGLGTEIITELIINRLKLRNPISSQPETCLINEEIEVLLEVITDHVFPSGEKIYKIIGLKCRVNKSNNIHCHRVPANWMKFPIESTP